MNIHNFKLFSGKKGEKREYGRKKGSFVLKNFGIRDIIFLLFWY